MPRRPLLPDDRIAPSATALMESRHADTVREVAREIERHAVVVVGMAQNPHVKAVRRALADAKITYQYLEYGSYFSDWRRRLSIKLWSGWPTFPQVFVRGVLIGGADATKAALADGTLQAELAGSVEPSRLAATP